MKAMDIETLLQWAYRDELPKAQAGQDGLHFGGALGAGGDPVWRRGAELAELGCVVDTSAMNRFGVISDRFAQGEPHGDAIAVAAAVVAYAGQGIAMPEGWDPLGDFDLEPDDRADAIVRGLGNLMGIEHVVTERYTNPDERVERVRAEWRAGERLRVDPVMLVITHAVRRTVPAFEGEQPVKRLVRAANGKTAWFRMEERVCPETGVLLARVEVDGMNHVTRKRYVDAYQRQEWVDDPALIVEDRALYEIWHAMLAMLSEDLAGMMDAHEALPPARPPRPWMTGAAASPLIWPDLAPQAMLAGNAPVRASYPPRRPKAGTVKKNRLSGVRGACQRLEFDIALMMQSRDHPAPSQATGFFVG